MTQPWKSFSQVPELFVGLGFPLSLENPSGKVGKIKINEAGLGCA